MSPFSSLLDLVDPALVSYKIRKRDYLNRKMARELTYMANTTLTDIGRSIAAYHSGKETSLKESLNRNWLTVYPEHVQKHNKEEIFTISDPSPRADEPPSR